jgi:hypothetical protein
MTDTARTSLFPSFISEGAQYHHANDVPKDLFYGPNASQTQQSAAFSSAYATGNMENRNFAFKSGRQPNAARIVPPGSLLQSDNRYSFAEGLNVYRTILSPLEGDSGRYAGKAEHFSMTKLFPMDGDIGRNLGYDGY